jgi:hypothetical protein
LGRVAEVPAEIAIYFAVAFGGDVIMSYSNASYINQINDVQSWKMKTLARSKLFDGEATTSHRTRINEARRAAREALATARDAKSTAAAAFQAGARCEEAVSQWTS